jgi:hypothetical protein
MRDRLLAVAGDAIAGRISDINIRRDGSLVLLNAGKDMLWTGFSPEAELLKGLVVRTSGNRVTDLVAGCLPKFYNHTERAENDAAFFAAMRAPGARVIFTEKRDGSLLRQLWHPDHGRVEFATRGMFASASATNGDFLDFCGFAAQVARAKYPALLDPAIAKRYTVCAELTSPKNRVITRYTDDDLVVITVIDLATGAEMPRDQVLAFCREHRLRAVEAISAASGDFDTAIARLRTAWSATDQEGAVVSVEAPGRPVPFRIKVKSLRYLSLHRLLSACTYNRTRAIAEENRFDTWPQMKTWLRSQYPDMVEEIVMGYGEHFARWSAWDRRIKAEVSRLAAAYDSLPNIGADQKTFAMSVKDTPDASAMFALRNKPREMALRDIDRTLRARLSIDEAEDSESA